MDVRDISGTYINAMATIHSIILLTLKYQTFLVVDVCIIIKIIILYIYIYIYWIYNYVGGCGSMYEIWIDSEQFSGKRLIQQHRMVNEVCLRGRLLLVNCDLYLHVCGCERKREGGRERERERERERDRTVGERELLCFSILQALGDDVVKSLHGLTIKIGNPKKSEG